MVWIICGQPSVCEIVSPIVQSYVVRA
jgi:hypothetical protein